MWWQKGLKTDTLIENTITIIQKDDNSDKLLGNETFVSETRIPWTL